MFYKILFLLTCYKIFVDVKGFIKANVAIKDGELVAIPKKEYVSIGITVLFYLMILSVCTLPLFLF